ncbi:MAG: RDD family protein [Asgard group archaeon]|nr:RDD family protein [Asgard group archaeon]
MSEEKKQTIKAELATIEKRIFAGLIDWAIMFGVILVVELLASIPGWIASGLLRKAALDPFNPNYSQWIATAATLGIVSSIFYTIISLLSVLAALFYFVWWPLNKNGQTFGKKMQKTKVVIVEDPEKGKVRDVAKGDLLPLFLRWILMIVDGILFGGVGLFLIYNSPDNQRLGDQIAKTAVVVVADAVEPKKTKTAPKTTTKTTPKTTTKTTKKE